ncbi:MAG: SDR family NAD(P)-dependent oxidoreductase [Alphaproteobacteria bacterium]|nr:SDR family NAD(P)-dependent oxidoreductase [Alphaproteobacteria bacterium]
MSQRITRAIVVGASSGIGAQLTLKLAAQGATVAALARRADALDALAQQGGGRVAPYPHDVTDFDAAPALFDRVVADLGGLDLLLYVAGVMPDVAESEYSFPKDRQMIEVNLLGAVAWINLAGAHFEAQRSGVICGVSSVAGDRGRRGNPVYTASKAGLTAYLEAMRNRLSRYGVSVVTVKPGPVETPMTEGLSLPFMIPADRAADEILAHIQRGSVSGYVPWIWRPIMMIIRNIPSFLFRRTNI